MLIRMCYIAAIVLLPLVACKKSTIEWDKETDLAVDTSLFVTAAHYVSHTANEVVFEFDIVQLNNLSCETNYNDVTLVNSLADSYLYSFSDFSVETYSPNSNYSSVFLIESSNYGLFNVGMASFYLRRYFEQTEGQFDTKKIALATFESWHADSLHFFKEKETFFGNSAHFNDSVISEFIRRTNVSGGRDGDVYMFRDVLFEVMDSLIFNPETSGEKSITIFDDYLNNGNSPYENDVLQEIITKANLNNIKLNVVCLAGGQYNKLAGETGGFIMDYRESSKTTIDYYDYQVTSIGNGLANLDLILRNDLTAYRFKLTVNNGAQFTYNSGQVVYLDFQFNEDVFRFEMMIP